VLRQPQIDDAATGGKGRRARATSGTPEVRLSYSPGLDGMRALAVMAVLLYHADLGWIPGGFLGVEVFFVISGYLITALLLSEWRQKGTIDLKNFWLRRARRLLPALYVLLVVTLAVAVVFLPGEVAGLRGDVFAAVGYVTNWFLIFGQESYFESVGRPSILQHLWSLAVEEQFYLIWPVVLAVGLGVGATRQRRRRVLTVALLGAAASAVAMALLYAPGVDPSRIYYGTDTRATGLLCGAVLAFLWSPGNKSRPAEPSHHGPKLPDRGRFRRRWGWTSPLLLDAVGLVALGALVWFFLHLGEFEPFLYRGGFALVALATVAAIMAVVYPYTHIGSRILGSAPLRWLGVRSYGIYLWHWPVFMVTRPELDVPFGGLSLLALRLAGRAIRRFRVHRLRQRHRRPLLPLRRDPHPPRRPGTRLEDAPRGAGTAAPAAAPPVGRRRRAPRGLVRPARRGRGPGQTTGEAPVPRRHEGGPHRTTKPAQVPHGHRG
jgi:peptidoglycan/LPS O-acetylase OafA/YrhL